MPAVLQTEEQVHAWITAAQDQQATGSQLPFAIVERATGRAVGSTRYLNILPNDCGLEIGWTWLARSARRTPVNTECKFLLLRHAFETLGYRRYEWKCNALNAPSRRAAERYSFSFEGIFRQHMIVKGRNRDTAWFSMLDTEWPARKAAFERWLDPSNFDAQGRQKTGLMR